MLRIFIGKPGSGKSSGALRDIISELVEGNRVVVTNLSIDLGKLNAFLQTRYPIADIDLHKRLHILTNDQCRRFWLYRSPTLTLPDVTRAEEKAGIFPDFGLYAGEGVLFVIDEAHIMFDARAWMESGPSLTYYNSQHRKLNDELIFVTQFVELIDKRVRGFAQDFWYFRNGAMEKMFTFFVAPSFFLVRVYQRPQTGAGGEHPSETHRYSLDKEMCDCYDTSAGVGITGRKRPEKKNKKGFNVLWLSVPLLVVAVLLLKAPDWFARGLVKATSATKAATDSVVYSDSSIPGEVANRSTLPPQSTDHTPKSEKLWFTGIIYGNNRINVSLTDGRVLSEGDGVLAHVARHYVVLIDGTRVYRLPADRGGFVGSGVRVTPVKRDGVPPAEALTDVPTQSGSGHVLTVAPGPKPETSSITQSKDSWPEAGSWRLDPDGVQRLRFTESFFKK